MDSRILLLLLLNCSLIVLFIRVTDLNRQPGLHAAAQAGLESGIEIGELPTLRADHTNMKAIALDAPIFHASRAFYVPPPPPPVVPEVRLPQLSVSGYFESSAGRGKAYLAEKSGGRVVGLVAGEQFEDWTVRWVVRDCVVLEKGDVTALVDRGQTRRLSGDMQRELLERCGDVPSDLFLPQGSE